jgi:hypothetical protein
MRWVPGFGSEVTFDGQFVNVRGRYHPGWRAPRLVASTAEDVTHAFDRLMAGDVLKPYTLTQMLTLKPLSNHRDEIHSGGMSVYGDRSSKRGRNYHHGGGGPGYNVGATVYTDTPFRRVSIASLSAAVAVREQATARRRCSPDCSNSELTLASRQFARLAAADCTGALHACAWPEVM